MENGYHKWVTWNSSDPMPVTRCLPGYPEEHGVVFEEDPATVFLMPYAEAKDKGWEQINNSTTTGRFMYGWLTKALKAGWEPESCER